MTTDQRPTHAGNGSDEEWPLRFVDENCAKNLTLVSRWDRTEDDYDMEDVWVVPHAGDDVSKDVYEMIIHKTWHLRVKILKLRAAAAWYQSLSSDFVEISGGKSVEKWATFDLDKVDPSYAKSHVQIHLDQANRIKRICAVLCNNHGQVLEIYQVHRDDLQDGPLRVDRSEDTVRTVLSGRGSWGAGDLDT